MNMYLNLDLNNIKLSDWQFHAIILITDHEMFEYTPWFNLSPLKILRETGLKISYYIK